MRRIIALLLISLLIIIGLVALSDPAELKYLLLMADPVMVLLAILAYTAAITLFALIWHILLKGVEIRLRFRDNIRLVFSSVFFNVVTPTASYGGEAVRAYLLTKKFNQELGSGVSTIVAHRIIGTLSNSLGAFIAAFYLIAFYSIPPSILVIMAVTTIVAILGFMLLIYLGSDLERAERIVDRMLGLLSRFKISKESAMETIRSYDKGFIVLLERKHVLLVAVLLGLLAWVMVNLVAVFSFMALGMELSFENMLVIITFFSVSRLIPTGLPEFVGSKEAILATLFTMIGFPKATSVAVILLIRLATQLWMVVLGGIITLELGLENFKEIRR